MTDPETTGPTADPSTDAAARVPTRPLGTGRSRLRWLVAGIVTLAVIVAAMGVAAFAGQRTSSGAAAPAYLPADTLVYADARLDLPGDQGQQLAAFLAKFPGFADQSALPAKLDDLMSRLVNETTHGKVDWGTDVKPWFGGQVAAGLIAVPASTNATTPPPSLIALTVTDEAAAGKAVDAALSRSGLAVTAAQSHRDVTIRTVKVPVPDTATTQGAPQSESLSFAVAPGMLLLSPQASTISQALDLEAGQGSSLADASAFTSAVGKLRADRLGTFYLDAPGLLAAVSKAAASASPAASAMAGLRDAVGGPIAAELHVEDGRLVAVSRTPRGSAMPAQTARTSDLAAHVPADSVLYVETHDAG
ncbi:MAG TPA: DUF3352 domain-containing protein, partial [Candidatus Limnocylindrales bacterium]|nr:DUF3352 domain-containing protein [Candidatus Limnocylindrales bacterium]